MENQAAPAFPSKFYHKESTLTSDTLPFKCGVPSCKTKFTTIEEYQKSAYKFFDFPKDPALQASWRLLCNVPKKKSVFWPPPDLKVCSKHFNFSEYEKILALENSLQSSTTEAIEVPLEIQEQEVPSYEGGSNSVEHEAAAIDSLRVKIARKKQAVDKKIKEVSLLRNTLKIIEFGKYYPKQKLQEKFQLESKLTPAQIEILKAEKKKVFWSDDDLAQAFSLRHMAGKDFYLYLKNTLCYPLPALACVQVWAGADQDNPVSECVNSNSKTIGSTPLFRVPRNTQAEAWAKALHGRIGDTEPFEAYICKQHFKPEDIFDKCKLREGAIPSIFPENIIKQPLKRRKMEESETPAGPSQRHQPDLAEGSRSSLYKLKATRNALEREYQQLEDQEKLLDETAERLTNEIKRRDPRTPKVSPEDIELLKKCFSPAQIELFANLTQFPKWDSNDFALAYVIYSMTSSEVYNHLRDHIKYPIPKLSGVFRYLKQHREKNNFENEEQAEQQDQEHPEEVEEEEEEEGVETIQIYTDDGEEDIEKIEHEVDDEVNIIEDDTEGENETETIEISEEDELLEEEELIQIIKDDE